jgi:hypothetical protein
MRLALVKEEEKWTAVVEAEKERVWELEEKIEHYDKRVVSMEENHGKERQELEGKITER